MNALTDSVNGLILVAGLALLAVIFSAIGRDGRRR